MVNQTTDKIQWPKVKEQKDKQKYLQSATHKAKDSGTQTPKTNRG